MKFRDLRLRLTRLPASTDLALFLIAEELKTTFFFNGLEQVGLSDCYYRPSFALAVLPLMGFPSMTDNVLNFYHAQIDKRCHNLVSDRDVITRQALKVYWALKRERKRLATDPSDSNPAKGRDQAQIKPG